MECFIETDKPKVIVLTEIFPKNSRFSLDRVEFNIDGYEFFTASLSKGRGVAIYTHTSLSASSVEVLNSCEFEESVWCEVKVHGTDKLLIGCIYRSPGKSTKENNDLLNLLMLKCSTMNYSHVLVAGDFNYKDINWETLSTDCTTNNVI